MSIAKFTFDEMIYNSIVNGKQIYYNGVLKTIDYVKLVKDTRQVQIICQVVGDNPPEVFLVNQDDVFEFEVNNPKLMLQPTLPKLRGENK